MPFSRQSTYEHYKLQPKGDEAYDALLLELQTTSMRLDSYQKALDANSIVSISDPDGNIIYVNDRFLEVSGYTQEELIGKNHRLLRHPDTKAAVFEAMWKRITAQKIWRGRLKNRAKDGSSYIVDMAIVPILNANQEIIEYIAIRHEITQVIEQKEEIEKIALFDELTGLGNRAQLVQRIKNNQHANAALVDIMAFHEINDFYGDALGDKVLVQFAKALQGYCPSGYELFRLYGDHFVIFSTTHDSATFRANIEAIHKQINNLRVVLDEKEFVLPTLMTLASGSADALLTNIHLARSFAKQNRKTFVVYSNENSLEAQYEENISWALKLKSAIDEGRIVPFFQPIVDSTTKETIKYEALVRLIDTDGKVISPFFFLERAKKSNQYSTITKLMFDKTLEAIKRYNISCSINITIDDIVDEQFNKHLRDTLEHFKHNDKITFELVESEGIESFEDVNSFIGFIKSYGCELAIDDFGTGYSNFEYLLRLNSDYIKIDGSLIKNICTQPDHYDIVSIITHFANKKGIKVIAEFVSDEHVEAKVKELGINYLQGYLYSEPKPIERFYEGV